MKIAMIKMLYNPFIDPYGLGYYIKENLEKLGCKVDVIGAGVDPWKFFFKVKTFFYKYILKKSYTRGREPYVIKKCTQQNMKELEKINYDIIFSLGALPISYLKSDKPIVFISDATFAGVKDFYDNFSHYTDYFVEKSHEYERLAYENSKIIFFPSEWAKKTAIDFYSFDPDKIVVVPWGANFETERKASDIENIIFKKQRDKCKLLFIGADWKRKRADYAIEIACLLNEKYFPTELHLVGSLPPKNKKYPDNIFIHGFVSKSNEQGRQYIDDLFYQSHFFLMPTKAESWGHVFCEANSYGIPAISTKVGGVPEVIIDGKNGKTFSLDNKISDYCDFISEYFNDWGKYTKLSLSSFNEFETRLNWEYSVKIIKQYLDDIFDKKI
jgi:glycosyltransferase involved in cell wall biosynthesis